MKAKSLFVAVLNLASGVMTAAPLVCLLALLAVVADMRFVLGSWPVVYGDDAGDWFAMSVGLIAFVSLAISFAGLVLWAPATMLAAKMSRRALFARRLLVFGGGWVLLAAIYVLDSTGRLVTFLRYGIS